MIGERNRLYGMCVHYGLKQNIEWKQEGSTIEVFSDQVVDRLAQDVKYLQKVLTPFTSSRGDRWEGFAFIFLDPGWINLVDQEGSPIALAGLGARLATAQFEIEQGLAKELGEPLPVQIVTAYHLIELMENLKADTAALTRWLIGESDSLKYDAPKIFEGVVRIANIGRQVPIFRFDDDVIFFGARAQSDIPLFVEKEAKIASENIVRLCDHHDDLLRYPEVHYFVYSGGYDQPDPKVQTLQDNDPSILNGFATRVLQVAAIPDDPYEMPSVSTDVAFEFLQDMIEIGANPFRQVVSGAGFCLSDSAILDLPPFSNMHQNVLWIDDHLKYALHDELGHLGRHSRTHKRARLPNIVFKQLRHGDENGRVQIDTQDALWHIREYLPRLVLGCVADGWLRAIKDLKLPTNEIFDAQYQDIREAVPGVYVASFIRALPGGWENLVYRTEMRQILWRRATQRLEVVEEYFSKMAYAETFLALYLQGQKHPKWSSYESQLPEHMSTGFSEQVANLETIWNPKWDDKPAFGPQDSVLQQSVVTLVNDFVDYIDLVEYWPNFVQAVRFLLNEKSAKQRDLRRWMFPVISV